MKRKQLTWISLCLGIHLLQAQNTAKWTPLFDGKTLNGWSVKAGTAPYKVINGAIVGTTVEKSPNTFLCTDKEYDDFILEFEFKGEGTMNSGVQIRSNTRTEADGKTYVFGWQMEIDPSPRAWTGGIYDERRRMWISFPNYHEAGKKAYKGSGTWNKFRIEALGKTVRTWVNGIPVTHLVDTLQEKGFIGLQVHSINKPEQAGQTAAFRNIRIQSGAGLKGSPLDDCPVVNIAKNALSETEKKQGWELLFNGQDLSGWRSAMKTTQPTGGWLVKDGELLIQGSDGSESRSYGDIVTTQNFKAFDLTFEFKLTEGANSGVKYFVNEALDAKGGSAIGLEYQLLDDVKHPDAKMGAAGNRTLASLYDLIPSYKLEPRFQRKIGTWNQARIVALPNNTIQHWLNGYKVVEYERKSNIFDALVARSKYVVFPGFGTIDEAPILLQDHGNTVFFRNIKIKKL